MADLNIKKCKKCDGDFEVNKLGRTVYLCPDCKYEFKKKRKKGKDRKLKDLNILINVLIAESILVAMIDILSH